MPQTIAWLRAINVGGRNVKMDRLAQLFRDLGLSGVATFIASGNVLFDTPPDDGWEARIEAHLAASLGFEVATMLRTDEEVRAVAAFNPPGFPVDAPAGEALSVGFLKAAPSEAAAARLLGYASATDSFFLRGRELFWWSRTKVSDSAFSGAVLERAAGMPATVRNITTVRKLAGR